MARVESLALAAAGLCSPAASGTHRLTGERAARGGHRSSQQPDQPCILNREEVAAGEHEVAVIDESGGPGAWS
jgi:hypothetical protein